MLVLKSLADASRDHDRIYAVVRATGVNQDGRTSGITVPNPEAQADLIRRVTAESGLRPEQIGYVEAHGTGTAVGDPPEMAALGETLGRGRGTHRRTGVGSIKNSIGHLESAAGVASVIKAALTLHHRQLAPQAKLNQLNPAIPFAEHQLRVITEAEPFPANYAPAAVSVNSFGYGGTNTHAVLVEAPKPTRPAVRRAPAQLLPVSGRNEVGARQLARELLTLVADPAVDPVVLADTMWSRRSHHTHRFAVSFGDRDDLLARLAAVVDGSVAGGRMVCRRHPSGLRVQRDGSAMVADGPGPARRRRAVRQGCGRGRRDLCRPLRLVGARGIAPRRGRFQGHQHLGGPTCQLSRAGGADRGAGTLRRAPEGRRRSQRWRGERCLRQRHARRGRRGQGQLPPRPAAGHHGRLGRDARRGSERGRGAGVDHRTRRSVHRGSE